MPVSSGRLNVLLSCVNVVRLLADSISSCVWARCFGCCEGGCAFASTDDSSFALASRVSMPVSWGLLGAWLS